MHGLGNLIQNAVQFAQREVIVTRPGQRQHHRRGGGRRTRLLAAVIARIGEPYISGRGAEAAQHMGLGIFIAQSLLERTGRAPRFCHLVEGGAQVMVEWPRSAFEASAPEPVAEGAGA